MEALQLEGTMAVLGAENLGTKMSVVDDPSKPTSIFENSEGGRRRRRRTLFGAGRRHEAASGNAGIFYPRGFCGSGGGGREGQA